MKNFTKQFMLANCGCYSEQKTTAIFFSKGNDVITADDILNANIPLKDKFWFFCKKVFDKKTNQNIAIEAAEIVLPIYESKYPDNKAPLEAVEAAKLYLTGHISLEGLLQKRRAAATATAATYAADAADAAYAAAAADAAYAATAAAYAADAYKERIFDMLKKHVSELA